MLKNKKIIVEGNPKLGKNWDEKTFLESQRALDDDPRSMKVGPCNHDNPNVMCPICNPTLKQCPTPQSPAMPETLTKRERFVMAALTGICGNPEYQPMEDSHFDAAAEDAVRQADRTIKAMEKKNELSPAPLAQQINNGKIEWLGKMLPKPLAIRMSPFFLCELQRQCKDSLMSPDLDGAPMEILGMKIILFEGMEGFQISANYDTQKYYKKKEK